jgi:hypothetical protein
VGVEVAERSWVSQNPCSEGHAPDEGERGGNSCVGRSNRLTRRQHAES